MKILCFLMLFTAGILYCFGASFDELSDDDAGQLVLSHDLRSILVFKKSVSREGQMGRWKCVSYKSSGSYYLDPAACSVLNYTESTFTPESAALELAYWKCVVQNERNRIRAEAFRKAVEKINSPVTAALLSFYAELDKHCRMVINEIREYKRASLKHIMKKESSSAGKSGNNGNSGVFSNSSSNQGAAELNVLMNALKTSLEDNDCLKSVDKVTDKDKNFFIALCMYQYFREKKVALLRVSGLARSVIETVYDEIQQAGDDIRTKFVQERSYNKTRESAFRTLCPDRHGNWEYAPPADMRGMFNLVRSCYRAWQKTLLLSPYSEFPEWGNAVLEVLQMVRNTALEQKFDSAYSEYRKYNSN